MTVDVLTGVQIIAVGVKDPARGDLLDYQAATGGVFRTIWFRAETDGTHIMLVAQMDFRGGPVSSTVSYYPAGSL